MVLYCILMYLGSLAIGYTLNFVGATHTIGRSLSTCGSPTGYQDAITPPRFTAYALSTYLLTLTGLIYGFWEYGWRIGLGVVLGFIFAIILNRAILLPKRESDHFRTIIVHSMINRQADYLKSGDRLRAPGMGELLAKLGNAAEDFVARTNLNGGQ